MLSSDLTELSGWDLSATCTAMNRAGEAFGRQIALAESGANALARVIAMQARKKFATDDPVGETQLDAFAPATTAVGPDCISALPMGIGALHGVSLSR